MAKLKLTVACGDYDIVRPLKEGLVEADGLDLIFLTDMGPRERHWRLARKTEFDVCEENVGAYFMTRDQDDPITAIPVFLHRRFRHGFVFVNTAAGIKSPKDLIGKPIGGTNFLPAGNIWMRGILEEHYGVPHRQNTWVVDRSEDIAFDAAVRSAHRDEEERASRSSDMLADGDIPAMISPTIPRPFTLGRQADRAAVPRLQGDRDRLFPLRPASSRSCTSPRSGRRSSTSIPGCRPTWSRRSRRRSRWPTGGCRTRAWCRSPGCARRSRSRRTFSAAIRGSMA